MRRRPGGFTLIELLVVIAILAILAAILLPVFAHAKRYSENQKQLAVILKGIAPGTVEQGNSLGTQIPTSAYLSSNGTLVLVMHLKR